MTLHATDVLMTNLDPRFVRADPYPQYHNGKLH